MSGSAILPTAAPAVAREPRGRGEAVRPVAAASLSFSTSSCAARRTASTELGLASPPRHCLRLCLSTRTPRVGRATPVDVLTLRHGTPKGPTRARHRRYGRCVNARRGAARCPLAAGSALVQAYRVPSGWPSIATLVPTRRRRAASGTSSHRCSSPPSPHSRPGSVGWRGSRGREPVLGLTLSRPR
jgi:hypothetical protein